MNRLLSKTLLLCSTMLLIVGCTKQKGEKKETREPITPGTKIEITKDNFFHFFNIEWGSLEFWVENKEVQQNWNCFAFDISLQVECKAYGYQMITREDPNNPGQYINEKRDVEFTTTVISSRLTEEEFANGQSSVIRITNVHDTLEKEVSYSFDSPYRIEITAFHSDGYAIANELFYDAVLVKDNYQYYLDGKFNFQTYQTQTEDKTVFYYAFREGSYYMYLHYNVTFILDYVVFNADRTVKSTTRLTVPISGGVDLSFPKESICTLKLVDITGDIYTPITSV